MDETKNINTLHFGPNILGHIGLFINTIYSEAKIKLSKVPLSLVEISNFKEGWNDFKCNL